MLTFTNSEQKQSNCFQLLGMAKSSNHTTHLITDTTNLITNNTSLLSDIGHDTCSFYNEPSDEAILSFGEQAESCGSIAYANSESCGSVAYSGDYSGVSVSSSCGGYSGGGCDFSC